MYYTVLCAAALNTRNSDVVRDSDTNHVFFFCVRSYFWCDWPKFKFQLLCSVFCVGFV